MTFSEDLISDARILDARMTSSAPGIEEWKGTFVCLGTEYEVEWTFAVGEGYTDVKEHSDEIEDYPWRDPECIQSIIEVA